MKLELICLVSVVAAAAAKQQLRQQLLRGAEDKGTEQRELSSCGIPMFDGNWETLTNYPRSVGEAQGGFIGNDLVVTGGFLQGTSFQNVTVETYALRAGDTNWRRMDDFPVAHGMTHAAFAMGGTRMYFCGGYNGGHPGQSVTDCFVYDHSITPGNNQQWSRLPDLPAPRAGGAMVYSEKYNALVFAGGAVRPNLGKAYAVDYKTVWMLPPDTPEYGWQNQTAIPHSGNHLGFVTTRDGAGVEHHYVMGGQLGEDERNGNLANLWEYSFLDDTWTTRPDLPEPRGHASSSTSAYSCGFLMAGGAINGGYRKVRTDDISFYDTETNTWTQIGQLTMPLKTPVCDVYDDYLYCSTGYTRQTTRRKLKMA